VAGDFIEEAALSELVFGQVFGSLAFEHIEKIGEAFGIELICKIDSPLVCIHGCSGESCLIFSLE
jgi:hypothetical protein